MRYPQVVALCCFSEKSYFHSIPNTLPLTPYTFCPFPKLMKFVMLRLLLMKTKQNKHTNKNKNKNTRTTTWMLHDQLSLRLDACYAIFLSNDSCTLQKFILSLVKNLTYHLAFPCSATHLLTQFSMLLSLGLVLI